MADKPPFPGQQQSYPAQMYVNGERQFRQNTNHMQHMQFIQQQQFQQQQQNFLQYQQTQQQNAAQNIPPPMIETAQLIYSSPLYQFDSGPEIPKLDPPFVKSPLYSSDASVLLCPHLIDSISCSLPLDAWEWESTEISIPVPKEDYDAEFELIKKNLQNDGRGHVVANFYETERNYFNNDLDVILNVFRKRLLEADVASETGIKNIFSGIDRLYELHRNFLSDLEDIIKVGVWKSETTSIGKLFIEHTIAFEEVYSNFIDAYSLSQKELKSLNKDPISGKFMAELEKTKEVNKQTLKDFLIKPIQRTTKYHNILKDLIKYTPETHVDYDNLNKAWEAMKTLANKVNTKKQEEEERTGLFEAYETTKNCPPNLVSSRRRMIHDIDVLDLKSNKKIHLFLCSDLLMVTSNIVASKRFIKSDNEKFLHKYIRTLELVDMIVEDGPDNTLKILNKSSTSSDSLETSPGGNSATGSSHSLPLSSSSPHLSSSSSFSNLSGTVLNIKFTEGFDPKSEKVKFLIKLKHEIAKCVDERKGVK